MLAFCTELPWIHRYKIAEGGVLSLTKYSITPRLVGEPLLSNFANAVCF